MKQVRNNTTLPLHQKMNSIDTKMKTVLIFAAAILLSAAVFGNVTVENEANETESVSVVESVQLTGSIMDDKNNETLVGATVFVDGKKYYSDLDGNFCISDIKPGKHQIKVELISYQPAFVEIDANNYNGINIYLQQN